MDATAAVLTSRLALTPIGLDDVSDLTVLHGDPDSGSAARAAIHRRRQGALSG